MLPHVALAALLLSTATGARLRSAAFHLPPVTADASALTPPAIVQPRVLPIVAPADAADLITALEKEDLGDPRDRELSLLRSSGVIGDVVPDLDKETFIKISYPRNVEVEFGNTLTLDETKQRPSIIIGDMPRPDARYILAMVDPDAPSRQAPTEGQFLHWLVASDSIELKDPTTLVPYFGPGAPPKTGMHRYCFLLYRQEASAKTPTAPLDRPRFKVASWADKNDLKLIGANFFYAQNSVQ